MWVNIRTRAWDIPWPWHMRIVLVAECSHVAKSCSGVIACLADEYLAPLPSEDIRRASKQLMYKNDNPEAPCVSDQSRARSTTCIAAVARP